MEYYFESYGDLALQRMMVSDQPRTDAFAAAIAEVLAEGDHVLDVGTGTGLLAMLSAKAGAAKVTGVDQATVLRVARKLVDENGLGDRVEVRDANAAELELDDKVDVLVSEWLGHFGYVEAMLDDVLDARDRNLKPGGVMIPSEVELFLAPTEAPTEFFQYGPGFWRQAVHGIDYSSLEDAELCQAFSRKSDLPVDTLLARGESLFSLSIKVAKKDDPWQSGTLCFDIERDGTLDGFLGWFDAQLSPSVRLGTGPHDPFTHWQQIHCLFPPRKVKRGQKLEVDFELNRHPVERRSLELVLECEGERLFYTVR